MMKLKTLNDLIGEDPYITKGKLKAEAIKWVKEDKKDFIMTPLENSIANIITLRWMERLNITEDDLFRFPL